MFYLLKVVMHSPTDTQVRGSILLSTLQKSGGGETQMLLRPGEQKWTYHIYATCVGVVFVYLDLWSQILKTELSRKLSLADNILVVEKINI